jgi:hypothetical protein
MTTLVAIAEPGRERGSEPRPSALLLSALLHILAVLLLVAMARLLPPAQVDIPPQERTVEVVVVPAPAPEPPQAAQPAQPAQPAPSQPQPPAQRALIDLPPPNLSETARFAPESALPSAPEVSQADRPDSNAQEAATSPAPGPEPQRSTPAEAAESVPAPQPPQPAPPQPQPQVAQPSPAQAPPAQAPPTPAPALPPSPHQMVIVVPPVQLETPPIPRPTLRQLQPQPLPQSPPQARPEPRQTPQGQGVLRDIDLFGPGRQAPRQTASARSGAPGPQRDATRTEGDFILRQILRRWALNYRDPQYHDMAFILREVPLLGDGTLGRPFGRTDPWNPYEMIENYGEFTGPGFERERYVIQTFLTAIRAAQPFQLPPTPGPYPRRIRIVFRFDDL